MFRRDVADMYGCINCREHRRRSNAIGTAFCEKKLRHLKSWRREFIGRKIAGAPISLAQGDSIAVEIATGSHTVALQEEAGVLIPSTQILGGTLPPLGADADALCIDDYLREHLFDFDLETLDLYHLSLGPATYVVGTSQYCKYLL